MTVSNPRSQPRRGTIFLYTEGPLRVGAGTGLGLIDLPIQREKLTKLPVMAGSGIRGALREATLSEALPRQGAAKDHWEALFGSPPPAGKSSREAEETEELELFAGAAHIGDASLLLFPVRSLKGGWTWLTSPLLLERLARHLELNGASSEVVSADALHAVKEGQALVAPGAIVLLKDGKDEALMLEEVALPATRHAAVEALAAWLATNALPESGAYAAFRARLAGQLAVVCDDDLIDLAQHATELLTRVRIDSETGTVAHGALWTEEALPAETLLWSALEVTDERKRPGRAGQPRADRALLRAASLWNTLSTGELGQADEARRKAARRLRFGGHQGVGRGIAAVRVHPTFVEDDHG
jgi:CRISPR-associated protein Cmr4